MGFRMVGFHQCALCGTESERGTPDDPVPPLPPGWREVRRGYAGLRTECDKCDRRKSKQVSAA